MAQDRQTSEPQRARKLSTSLRWDDPRIRELIQRALDEDVGTGDATTAACVPAAAVGRGIFLTRQPLVVAGTQLLPLIYEGAEVNILRGDGSELDSEVVFARVSGKARRLLTLERTALNLLQRACGVATLTRQYVKALDGTGCTLLDTRKTAPGMRLIDKLAVRAGGGTNHRMGLYDAILVKNNHIDMAGSVTRAVDACQQSGLPVEVEVRNFKELNEALACSVGHVLLDNFTPDQVIRAVGVIAGRAKIEVSGMITLATIRKYAEAGADFASVGALTHSAPAADISFRFE